MSKNEIKANNGELRARLLNPKSSEKS